MHRRGARWGLGRCHLCLQNTPCARAAVDRRPSALVSGVLLCGPGLGAGAAPIPLPPTATPQERSQQLPPSAWPCLVCCPAARAQGICLILTCLLRTQYGL
eukprot:7704729-Alexandrium_andersonii.AAC.1